MLQLKIHLTSNADSSRRKKFQYFGLDDNMEMKTITAEKYKEGLKEGARIVCPLTLLVKILQQLKSSLIISLTLNL